MTSKERMCTRCLATVVLMLMAGLSLTAMPAWAQDQNSAEQDPVRLMEQGAELFNEMKYDQSWEKFDRALEIDDQTGELTDQQRTRLEDMYQECELAKTLHAAARQAMQDATTYEQQQDYDQAIAQYRVVLDAQDYVPASWVEKAQIEIRKLKIKRSQGIADTGAGAAETTATPADDDQQVTAVQVDNDEAADELMTDEVTDQTSPAEDADSTDSAAATTGLAEEDTSTDEPEDTTAAATHTDETDIDEAGHAETTATEADTSEEVIVVATADDQQAAPAQGSLLDEIQAENDIRRQQAIAKINQAEQEVRLAVGNSEFARARVEQQYASQVLEASRWLFTPEELSRRQNQIKQLEDFINKRQQVFQERQMDQTAQRLEQQVRSRERDVEDQKLRRIESLVEQAKELDAQREYEKAIEIYREILAIEPQHQLAEHMIYVLQDAQSFREQEKITEDIRSSQRSAIDEATRTRIAISEDIKYPDDWAEMSARHEEIVSQQRRQDVAPAVQNTQDKLEQIVEEIDYERELLSEVVRDLRDEYGINILLNQQAFLLAQSSPEIVEVTVALRNTPLRAVLDSIVRSISTDVDRFGFFIDDNGIINVTSAFQLEQESQQSFGIRTVRYFDITDLTIPRVDTSDLDFELDSGGGGGGNFSSASGESGDQQDAEEIAEDLLEFLRKATGTDNWREEGDGLNEMFTWPDQPGRLAVYATPNLITQIEAIIKEMRKAAEVQIRIEAIFLTVRSNYLERIGLDLDIVFNQGNAGYDYSGARDTFGGMAPDGFATLMPRQFARTGRLPATPGGPGTPLAGGGPFVQPYGTPGLVPLGNNNTNITPIPMLNGSRTLTAPQDTGVPGSLYQAPPAFTLLGSFLDNLQVNFLIEATQADSFSSISNAPNILLQSGQEGYIFTGEVQDVVQGNQATQGGQVDDRTFGTALLVKAAATEDLNYNYVTMRVTPIVSRPVNIRQVAQQFVGEEAVGTNIFDLVTEQRTELDTMVTVPNGATLLLGGQKLSGETEIEAGPPILSKIPGLKRLFSNTSLVQDDQTLLVLIKPSVILREEQERKAAPTPALSRGSMSR